MGGREAGRGIERGTAHVRGISFILAGLSTSCAGRSRLWDEVLIVLKELTSLLRNRDRVN